MPLMLMNRGIMGLIFLTWNLSTLLVIPLLRITYTKPQTHMGLQVHGQQLCTCYFVHKMDQNLLCLTENNKQILVTTALEANTTMHLCANVHGLPQFTQLASFVCQGKGDIQYKYPSCVIYCIIWAVNISSKTMLIPSNDNGWLQTVQSEKVKATAYILYLLIMNPDKLKTMLTYIMDVYR